MAAHGARRLGRMNANLAQIIGIEALCAAAGVEFRAPAENLGHPSGGDGAAARDVATLGQDRYCCPRSGHGRDLVREGELIAAVAGLALAEVRPDPGRGLPGDSPVILVRPHTGTWLPDDLRAV